MLVPALPMPAQSAPGEIRDPFTGATWRMERDAEHPGGPARLVLVSPGDVLLSNHAVWTPVIHSGERIVIEEHSPVLDARLEAVALANAAEGEILRARMVIGGAVVVVRCVGRGNTVFHAEAKQ